MTVQTGLIMSLCAVIDLAVYLAVVSIDEIRPDHLPTMISDRTRECVLFILEAKESADGMTVIWYLTCHLPSYIRTR